MKFRAGIAVLALVGGLTVACGGGEAVPTLEPTITTSSSASTTTTSITTTTTSFANLWPATTTTSTTTTTVPPWRTLPDPEMPVVLLTVEGEEGVEVDSFCLDGTAEGPRQPQGSRSPLSIRSLLDSIAEWLRYLGIDVVEVGCDARLTLTLSGTRQSARYRIGLEDRFCWPGITVESEATLSLADGQRQTWAETFSQDPPELMYSCPSQDQTLNLLWTQVVFDDAFYEMFGDLGALVMAWESGTAGWQTLTTELSESAVQALTYWLVNDDPYHFIRVLEDIATNSAWLDPLRPMTPYVIRLLRCPETQCTSPSATEDLARDILEALWGRSDGTQEYWWDWWETTFG